jgi:hypothetical protein
MAGAAAEVPQKYSKVYIPFVPVVQLAPPAAKQPKYPSWQEEEKEMSGV